MLTKEPNETGGTKKKRDATSKIVAKWLPMLGRHFDRALDSTDYDLYEHGLRGVAPGRIEQAFDRCLQECAFFPRLKDLFERLPEHDPVSLGNEGLVGLKVVRQWVDEATSKRVNYRFYELEGGARVVRAEPKV